jgi:hypothetical protein
VFPAVPIHIQRAVAVSLAAACCLLGASRQVHASGCHAQDRPVLRVTFSWDQDQRRAQYAAGLVFAPPVLTHPPCQGEIPQLDSAVPSLGLGILDDTGRAWCIVSDRVAPEPLPERSMPPFARLDRPPRPDRFVP